MKKKLLNRNTLSEYLETYLLTTEYKDYCPNGLQVQGKEQIKKIVCGVTASKELIEKAIDAKADAIIVHHGWFWKNDDPRITGQLYERLKLLMSHQMNLFAYHLPLDNHAEVGNNVQLAKILNINIKGQHPQNQMVWLGELEQKKITLEEFGQHLAKTLNREPLIIGDLTKKIKKVAWCTGGAQHYFKDAIDLNVDVYISGEISEPTFHLTKEFNVAYISAGHHATERGGIIALGEHLQTELGLECQFIDIPNPV
jgi:dinuclear metal center YbgI/SA1388 family protein